MFKSKNNNIIYSDFKNNAKLIKDNFADESNCKKSPFKECENKNDWPCCGGSDFSDNDNPWICMVGSPFRLDDKGRTVLDKDKIKKGVDEYNKIRNGEGTEDQKTTIELLINTPNFCSLDTPGAEAHMVNNPTKTGIGYSLGCVDSTGEPVPNCACDPNCWPNTLGCMNIVNDSLQATSCFYPNDKPDDMSAETSASEGNPDSDGKCPAPNTDNLNQNLADMERAMGMDQVCKQHAFAAQANGEMHGKYNAFGLMGGNIGASFGASISNNSNEGCGQRTLNVMQNTTNIQNLQCSMASTDSKATVKSGSNVSIIVKQAKGKNVQTIIRSQQKAIQAANNNVRLATEQVANATNMSSKTAEQILQLANDQYKYAVEAAQTTLTNVNFTAKNDVTIINGIDTTVESALSVVTSSMSDLKQKIKDNITNQFGTGALGDNENEVIDNEVYQNLTNLTQSIIDIKTAADIYSTTGSNITVVLVPGQKLENINFDASNEVNLAQSVINQTIQTIANDISNSMILDAANDLENHTKHSGLDDLVREMGEANRKNQDSGGGSDWMWMIIGIVVVIGLIMFIMPGDDGESTATKLAKTAADSQKPF